MTELRKPLPFPESGALIRHFRDERGYSQETLAEMVGVTRKHLGDIETGRKMASLKLLDNLARELGTSIEKLLRASTQTDAELMNSIMCQISRIEGSELRFLNENIRSLLTTMKCFRISSVEQL